MINRLKIEHALGDNTEGHQVTEKKSVFFLHENKMLSRGKINGNIENSFYRGGATPISWEKNGSQVIEWQRDIWLEETLK